MGKAFGSSRPSTHDSNDLGRRFRQRLAAGDVLLGGMIFEVVKPLIVKIYKHVGFDFIYVDNEHVLLAGVPEMASFVQLARDNDIPVVAKCPELGRPEVARLLEAGVSGIQLPRTESRQDIETLHSYMKFPPVGTRAAAPILGNVDYIWPPDIKAWMEGCNESTFIVGHIETRRGYENAEEIISTPGLDMLYIGPLDFSISMGRPGEFDHPDITGPMQHILELCLRHNVAFGMSCSSAEAAGGWIARGARFFEVVDEMTMITRTAEQIVDEYSVAIKTVQAAREFLGR